MIYWIYWTGMHEKIIFYTYFIGSIGNDSIRWHIKDLPSKKYQGFYYTNNPRIYAALASSDWTAVWVDKPFTEDPINCPNWRVIHMYVLWTAKCPKYRNRGWKEWSNTLWWNKTMHCCCDNTRLYHHRYVRNTTNPWNNRDIKSNVKTIWRISNINWTKGSDPKRNIIAHVDCGFAIWLMQWPQRSIDYGTNIYKNVEYRIRSLFSLWNSISRRWSLLLRIVHFLQEPTLGNRVSTAWTPCKNHQANVPRSPIYST